MEYNYSYLSKKIQSNIHKIKDINNAFHTKQSFGERISDVFVDIIGSWTFIIIQSVILIGWMAINIYILIHPVAFMSAWDPYPFILLNLALSTQAAYTGSIVMMSQNRRAKKDRLMAENDFLVNQKSEEDVQHILQQLENKNTLLLNLLEKVKKDSFGNNG